MPFDVEFISFDDLKNKGLDNYDVVINAGFAGSAWSGGEQWKDEKVVSLLTEWVNNGGAFIGVNEPSATDGYDTFFRMSHVLGVSEDTGARICHGKYSFDVENNGAVVDGTVLAGKNKVYLVDGETKVLAADGDMRQSQLISSVKVPVFICQALSMAKLITEHFLTLFLLPQAKAQTKSI